MTNTFPPIPRHAGRRPVRSRPVGPRLVYLGVLAAGLTLAGCASLYGGHGSGQGAPAAQGPAPQAGAPKGGGAHRTAKAVKGLSVDTPISVIAADPAGKAVLERDLPGLLEHPEFGLFKSMTLKALVPLSNGKITPAKLAEVQRDLQNIPPKGATVR